MGSMSNYMTKHHKDCDEAFARALLAANLLKVLRAFGDAILELSRSVRRGGGNRVPALSLEEKP